MCKATRCPPKKRIKLLPTSGMQKEDWGAILTEQAHNTPKHKLTPVAS